MLYDLVEAKESVAQRVFSFFNGGKIDSDDEEQVLKVFRKMKTWNAPALLEKFLPEAQVLVQPGKDNFTVNVEYDGDIKGTATEKSLHLARQAAVCSFLRSADISEIFYSGLQQGQITSKTPQV